MNESFENVLKAIVFGFLIATSIIYTWTFIGAYLEPSKSVIVTINEYGEANIELTMLILFWIISIIYFMRRYTNANKKTLSNV